MFELHITPYAVALLISAVISAVLAFVVWRRRTAPGGIALFWLMLAVVEWQLTGACEAAAMGTPVKIFWSKISYVGTLSAPVLLFVFALRYSHQEKWLTRRNLALLWLIPVISFGLAVTNEWHHLIWTSFTPSADPAQNVLIYGHGAWFWIMVAYVYLLLSTATLVLIRAALRYRHLYRRQAALVLLAMPFPWIGNILYVFNWGPFPGQDLTLVGFAITGVLLTLNLYQFHLLDLVPMARDALIENMSDGVLVLDAEDRIVDINPAACQLVEVDASCIGKDADTALAVWPELIEICQAAAETQAEIRLGSTPPRYLDVHVSHLYDRRKLLTGRLITLRDITERQRAEEALRESEKRFSGIFENATIGLYRTTPGGRILMANPALLHMLGYSSFEELAQRNLEAEGYEPEYPRSAFKQRVESEGQVIGLESAWVKRDGTTLFVRESAVAICDEAGNTVHYEGAVEDITERQRVEAEIRQRTAQLEALRQVGLEIAAQLDLDALLHSIVSRAVELVNGNSGGLYLYRPERDVLEWAMAVGPHLAPIGTTLRRGEGLSGRVWESGEPLIVDDYQRWEERAAIYEGYPFRVVVGVPVRWGGEFLGVLNVLAAPPHTFSPSDAELLNLFATHAAIAIENARVYESEYKRSAELEALRQAGLHLTSTLELQPILEAILDHTLNVVAADDAHIFPYDGERLTFGAALWADGYQQKPYAEPRSQGLTYTVARSGERMVIPDVNRHPLFRDYQWGGAIVGLPLRIGERVVGVMTVAFERPHTFDESELRVLGLLADQASIAIENARLYAAEQHLAQERGNLLAIAEATTSTLDMTEVLRLVTQRAAQACGAHRCTILLLDKEGKTLTPAMSQLASGRLDRKMWRLFKGTLYPRPLEEVPEVQQVLQGGRPLFIPYALLSSLPRYWIEPFNVKSLLVVPMISKGRPIGVMGLDHTEEGKGFDAEQVNLAMTIGAQAAIAIENARLYEETRQRVTELSTLYDVATAAAASIHLDEILDHTMAVLQETLRPDDVAILLVETETKELVIHAHSGFRPTLMRQAIGVGIPGWVVQAGQPALLADVRQDERYHPCDPDTRSELCVPLRVGERIIGAINLESHRLAAFSEEDLRLLSILAGNLAAVIENARLFEEIEERRMYVEGVLGAAPDAIVTLDARHRIAEWNLGAERLFGYSREEVIGQDIDPLVTNPDVIEEATEFRQMVLDGEELPPVETVRYRKDGSPVDVLLAASPILAEGELIGIVTVYTDITERVRAEKALKEYSERLEEMVEERTLELQKAYSDLRDSQARLIQSEKLAATGRLAVSVAHEINNPLQGITNYLSVISQQVAQDDPLHEDLDMVKLGFDRIAEIVRRLGAFYRPAGEGMEPTDINGVVERVLALVGHQLSLGKVKVKTELAEHELLVLGSAGQLEQVLVNLALNAQEVMTSPSLRAEPQAEGSVEAPQGGELTVRTTLNDDVVQLQVSDTGHGISEEEMSRLFKPFYSGRGSKGLGLGLWISHSIIEGHSGRIEVESQLGEGTTFTISLPAYQRDR